MCVHEYGAPRAQRRVSDLLGLELQAVRIYRISTGSSTWVLEKQPMLNA